MDGEAIWNLVRILLEIVGGAAILATQTKNGSTNKGIDKALRLINLVGQNYGQARNK